MTVVHLTQEQMRAAVSELEQALYNHERWTDALYAVLVCRLAPDERDISEDAFRRCQFGQWYYAAGHLKLDQFPGFAEIEIEHRRMHQYAMTLLRASIEGTPISLQDYERFTNALKRTRLEITSLKHELETSLYNLDPLTGVSSRVGMLGKLREQMELAKRGVQPTCVAMFDIDHFKEVNDRLGHAAGDQVLIAIAHYLQSHVRPYDKIYRYGGEEFLLCMPDADLDAARKTCERLGAELAGLRHRVEGGGVMHVTVSAGLAMLAAEIPVEETIKRADAALYAAKNQGRNRVVVWDSKLPENELGAAA